LNIITEVHLRLVPIPENIMSAVCHFSNLESSFYEFHGSETTNKETVNLVEEISKNNNDSQFK
jgi:hypothetical protein